MNSERLNQYTLCVCYQLLHVRHNVLQLFFCCSKQKLPSQTKHQPQLFVSCCTDRAPFSFLLCMHHMESVRCWNNANTMGPGPLTLPACRARSVLITHDFQGLSDPLVFFFFYFKRKNAISDVVSKSAHKCLAAHAV